MTEKAFVIEAQLLRWGDNNASGRTVTFQLPELPGDHPFKGLPSGTKNGQRVALSVALIGDDESTVPLPQEGASDAIEHSGRPEGPEGKASKKFAQRAGALCAANLFQLFLGDQHGVEPSEEAAARFMREYCGVKSRTEIFGRGAALTLYNDLLGRFHAWQSLVDDPQ